MVAEFDRRCSLVVDGVNRLPGLPYAHSTDNIARTLMRIGRLLLERSPAGPKRI